MSLKAGRVGVHPGDVDLITGHISPVSVNVYTKAQADAKFETKVNANEKFTYADNRMLGAKNLLKNTAITETINGITFTVNVDGSVTANGTASSNAALDIGSLTGAKLKEIGNVILTGGLSENVYMGFRNSDWSYLVRDNGDGLFIDVSQLNNATTYYVSLSVKNGTSVNATSYPMLRLASDTDNVYVPYAMTNKEITDFIAKFNSSLSTASDFSDFKTAMSS